MNSNRNQYYVYFIKLEKTRGIFMCDIFLDIFFLGIQGNMKSIAKSLVDDC